MKFHSVRFLLAAAVIGLAAMPATAQEVTVKATHGDWQVQCPPDVSETNPCAMVQNLIREEDGRRVLAALVVKPPEGDPFLRVVVPLGILLPGGLTLSVDGTDMGTVGFINCLPDGCMTQVGLTVDVLEQMRQGSQALVTIYEQAEQPIQLPISLTGFTAAFGEL